MVGPKKFLYLDIQAHTDKAGRVRCWMCGAILANIRRRTDHPTLLCPDPCYKIYRRECKRVWQRDNRLKKAILAGRLVGPPISTDYLEALRS
jgi:hypothetical protein